MIALSIASTVATVMGVMAQASAAENAAEYNAAVDKRNQKIALEEGRAQADAQRRKNEQALGRIQAAYGAAGIDLSGDALGVYQDSAAQADFDLAKTRFDTKLRAIGYSDAAGLEKMKAKAASTAGVLGAFGAAAKGFGQTMQIASGTGSSILQAS